MVAKQNKTEYRLGENKLEFTQSSKGFWYCQSITVNCFHVLDGVIVMERAIEEVEKLLEKINTTKQEDNNKKLPV